MAHFRATNGTFDLVPAKDSPAPIPTDAYKVMMQAVDKMFPPHLDPLALLDGHHFSSKGNDAPAAMDYIAAALTATLRSICKQNIFLQSAGTTPNVCVPVGNLHLCRPGVLAPDGKTLLSFMATIGSVNYVGNLIISFKLSEIIPIE